MWECSLDLASHVAKNVDFKDKTVLEVPFSFTQYSFMYNVLFLAHLVIGLHCRRYRCDRDRMVVGFTTTCVISAYHQ